MELITGYQSLRVFLKVNLEMKTQKDDGARQISSAFKIAKKRKKHERWERKSDEEYVLRTWNQWVNLIDIDWSGAVKPDALRVYQTWISFFLLKEEQKNDLQVFWRPFSMLYTADWMKIPDKQKKVATN